MSRYSLNYTNKSKNNNIIKNANGWAIFFIVFAVSGAVQISIPYAKRNLGELFGSYFNEFFQWLSEINFFILLFCFGGTILFLIKFFKSLKSD